MIARRQVQSRPLDRAALASDVRAATMQALKTASAPWLKTSVKYAGFWWRVLASLIDTAVLFGVYFAIYGAVRVLAPESLYAGPLTLNGKVDVIDVALTIVPLTNIAMICSAVGWAYFVVLESSPLRGTLGKAAVGLYVGDTFGDPISFGRAFARNALKLFSSLVLGLGWIMPAFTPRKQALHDVLARTLVLRRTNYFVFGRPAPVEPGEHWDGTHWVAAVPPREGI